MNEHGLYHLVDTGKKVKGDKLTDHFPIISILRNDKHPTERKWPAVVL